MTAFDQLGSLTYTIQHNPNCPSPFLVRLVGDGSAVIDLKYPTITKDRLGYGKTLEEAIKKALSRK